MSKRKAEKPLDLVASLKKSNLPADDTTTSTQPVLDESSFKNLQEKIQLKLQNGNKKTKGNKQESKTSSGGQDIKDVPRGKKRNSLGAVVGQTAPIQSTTSGKGDSQTQPSRGDEDDEMQKALKELGGTQEDLDLIADAGSESEL